MRRAGRAASLRVHVANFENVPFPGLAAEDHVDRPAGLGELGRGGLDRHGPDAAFEPQRRRFDALDPQGVLHIDVVGERVLVDTRPLRLLVEQPAELFGSGQVARRVVRALDGVGECGRLDPALVGQPFDELLRDPSGLAAVSVAGTMTLRIMK